MARTKSNNFDVNGREYARVADVKCGDILEIDGGFTCMKKGGRRTVRGFDSDLRVECRRGEHHLVGQLSRDGTHYVGMYKVDP